MLNPRSFEIFYVLSKKNDKLILSIIVFKKPTLFIANLAFIRDSKNNIKRVREITI